MRKKKAGAVAIVLAIVLAVTVGGVSYAVTEQWRNVRLSVIGQLIPFRLPRTGTAPIAVLLSGHISTTTGEIPPQLARLTIKINKHGKLRPDGLPSCHLFAIQPASTERALQNCGKAVVGSGRFWANVVLPEQDPYATRGRLIIFNGVRKGHKVLFAHIFTRTPFATSFVITFSKKHISQGPYGTELRASLPQALGTWGYVDRIKLTLKRFFHKNGKKFGYFNAGCPAPKGFRRTNFKLAKVRFMFAGGKEVPLILEKPCGVKR